jgi:hypothetical protein
VRGRRARLLSEAKVSEGKEWGAAGEVNADGSGSVGVP